MKQQNNGGASGNANERMQPDKNLNSQQRDPRARQWNIPENTGQNHFMSHAPKRDMSGERKDIDMKKQ